MRKLHKLVIAGVAVAAVSVSTVGYHAVASKEPANAVSYTHLKELPDEWKGIEVFDYTGRIIFPGMCDLHMHAPQYAFRGIGMNLENPDWDMWFEKYAFPDEKRYEDCEYAGKAYERLTDDLLKTTTTRCVMFGTLHRQSTEILMDLLEEKGIAAYVGKVNMDRNSIPGLLETTKESLEETRRWIADCETKQYKKCRPMITPRYIPTRCV